MFVEGEFIFSLWRSEDANMFASSACCVGAGVDASSVTLVPGDILEITNDMSIPCDLVLLSGQAIMNESMLTGEPLPHAVLFLCTILSFENVFMNAFVLLFQHVVSSS